MRPGRVFAGVDGCRGGWVVSIRAAAGGPIETRVERSFADIVRSLPSDALIVVDMPIGLPDRVTGGRAAERAARIVLGSRRSSVFSMPARGATEEAVRLLASGMDIAEAHRLAGLLARSYSDPPRSFSRQGLMLLVKVVEIDALLRGDSSLAERVWEGHPEVAFAVLNGGQAVGPKKLKSRVHPAGMAERIEILGRHGVARTAMAPPYPRGAGQDDVLDSLAMLVVAERISRGEAVSFPDPPGQDRYGLRIAIWA